MACKFWKRTLIYIYVKAVFLIIRVSSAEWVTYDNGSTYYSMSSDKLTHSDAIKACRDIGASLVRLNSYLLAEALGDLLTGSDDVYYIDLEDTVKENTFRYADGGVPTWTKWAPYEPNDTGKSGITGIADCVVYKPGEGMADRECSRAYRYVCFREPSTTTEMVSSLESTQHTTVLEAGITTQQVSTSAPRMTTQTNTKPESKVTISETGRTAETTPAAVRQMTNDFLMINSGAQSTEPTTQTWATEPDKNNNTSNEHNISSGALYEVQWNVWTQWTACTVSCRSGNRFRLKICSEPEEDVTCTHSLLTTNGNRLGYGLESAVCNAFPCPENGIWLPWSQWDTCSVTCGKGLQRRERTCLPPKYGGNPCNGSSTEYKMCEHKQCPEIAYRIEKIELMPSFTDSDYRPSAVGIGITGSLTLAVIGIVMLCMDIPNLKKQLKCKERSKRKFPRKDQDRGK